MPGTLWQFAFGRSDQNSVPQIKPSGTTEGSYQTDSNFLKGTYVVNVRDEFCWTGSKKKTLNGGREEVPYIVLKERRVKASSYVAQLLYSAGTSVDSIKTIAAYAKGSFNGSDAPTDVAKEVSTLLRSGSDKFAKTLTGIPGAGGRTKDLAGSVAVLGQVLADKLDSVQDDSNFLTDPWLKSYKNLYLTEPTGWVFFMPYFADTYQSTTNTWGSDESGSAGQFLFRGLTETTKGVADLLADVSTSFEVGSYQEAAKFFQYKQEGDSLTIKFPLINTGDATYEDVIRNWQLIFLLLYNNRPERLNRVLVEPPPIYEVLIPGLRYMPLTYISGINVEMVGARRQMKLSLPGTIRSADNLETVSQLTEFTTIVPEAYNITITLQGLIADSKNLMYSTIADNSKVKVVNINDLSRADQLKFTPLPAQVDKVVNPNQLQA